MTSRKLVQQGLIGALGFVLYAGAQAAVAQTYITSIGDELALLFCSQVRYNNTSQFRNTLREYRLRIRDIYPRVRCNGETMIQFAQRHQAVDMGLFLAASVTLRELEASDDRTWSEKLPEHNVIRQAIEQRFE